MNKYAFPLATAILLSGCSYPETPVVQNDDLYRIPTLNAQWERSETSRTLLQEDGVSVWWSASEDIKLFVGNLYSQRYLSLMQQPSPTATFGEVFNTRQFGPGYENLDIRYTDEVLALYPYSESDLGEARSVTFSLPSVQQGISGTFANRLLPAMAYGRNPDSLEEGLTFYHVCGGIRFSVTQKGIVAVVFKSIGGEPLSGSVSAGFGSDARPAVNAVNAGIDSVKVTCPGGFVPGDFYFAVLLPQTLSQGISIKYVKGRQSAQTCVNKQITVRRARFGKLDGLDKGLDFQDDPSIPVVPEGNISFEDEQIKEQLVAAFDGDHDGELSYEEAAAVTSLDGVFGASKAYQSFDELQYFTGVEEIPAEMCLNWTELTSICFPSGLKRISSRSFQGCSRLGELHLPEGLTTIETFAFQSCSALTTLKLPDSITKLGYGAFLYCDALTSLTVGRWIETEINPPAVITPPENVRGAICQVFGQDNQLRDITLTENITTIAGYAFNQCTRLQSITLPETVSRIGDYAFCCCRNLSSFLIPHSVTEIGKGAFQGCTHLTGIVVPEGVFSLGASAFSGCTGLLSANLQGPLTVLYEKVFYQCTNLSSITLPESLEEICFGAFQQCLALEEILLPDQLIHIGGYAFSGCSKLREVVFPDNLEVIDSYAFSGCIIMDTPRFPTKLTLLGNSAFENCKGLTEVLIPQTLTSWGYASFSNCEGLSSVAVEKGLQYIPNYAFQNCRSLPAITIPDSIEAIGSSAFQGCRAMSSIHLPPSVHTIGESAFRDCSSLQYAIIESLTPPAGVPGKYDELLGSNRFDNTNNCPIFVPDTSVSQYQGDVFFEAYSDRIRPLSVFSDSYLYIH